MDQDDRRDVEIAGDGNVVGEGNRASVVKDNQAGVVGDHAHIEGGVHFHQGARTPPRLPLERPVRAVHFTDRERALAELLDELRPGRAVTLCGPGGIGKSALAAEAVWTLTERDELLERFPDGVLFHSFYGRPDPALALEHFARSYGEEPRPSPADAALRALAGRCAGSAAC
jgi:hypothetical protein